ncbi:MAG: YncE family protein [Solirubrobacteraceae bacterium]
MTCSQTPATITVGLTPWGVAVDQATDTVYVANPANWEYAGSVSVINGATCNGTDPNGCSQTPQTVAAGFGVENVAIDPSTDAVYAANTYDASVSVINGATCNRLITYGCSRVPPELATGDYPRTITLDPAVSTAYVGGQNSVSVIPISH